MTAFKALARAAEISQQYLVAASGLGACILILAAAFMRYVLHMDFYGVEELIILSAYWLYFIGASLATREDSHISADMLTSLIKSPRKQRIVKTAQHAISLAISVLGSVWAYNYLAWSFARSPKTQVLKIPIVWMQTPILIFFVLSNCYLLGHLIADLRASGGKDGPA